MPDLLHQIAERMQNTYYGKYRGFVSDNNDPEHRARLRLTVPSVLGEEVTGWALPCMPFGGLPDQGQFTVPQPGAQVWVEFEAGELAHPIWTGTFWQNDGDAPAALDGETPSKRMLKTPSGHILEFEDREGEEHIHLIHKAGSSMQIDENGTLALTDAQGASLRLDADSGEVVIRDANGNSLTMNASGTVVEDGNGNRVEMAASGITLAGQQIVINGSQVMLGGLGGEPIIKGQSFLTMFMTHIHPTGTGPSGPPIPQGEMSTLSMKVLTS
ncbi:MAG: phage tail protein [Zetaproteobacteria bacterium CG1_02_53_45]|nr:MAG: phage tail protein [Zetaproteobacteria bacterium CG1_02_53_45]